jgi:hypothetical protein
MENEAKPELQTIQFMRLGKKLRLRRIWSGKDKQQSDRHSQKSTESTSADSGQDNNKRQMEPKTRKFVDKVDQDKPFISAPLIEQEGYSKIKLHYFWCSRTLCQIYLVFLAAILLRRLWILHALSLILLRLLAERLIDWCFYWINSNHLRRSVKRAKWMFYFGLDQAEKTTEGDTWQTYLAGTTFLTWNSVGAPVASFLWRWQMSNLNAIELKQSRELTEQYEKLRQSSSGRFLQYQRERLVEKRREIFHSNSISVLAPQKWKMA